MTKRLWKIAVRIILIGCVSFLFGLKFGIGWLLGCGAAVLLYYRNESYWNAVMDTGSAGRWTGSAHFLINYAIMAVTLIAGAKFPKYINIFTTAAGMFLIKMTALVGEGLGKGRDDEYGDSV